jgi:hypothetical protein
VLRAAAIMAILFAVTLAAFETWINWGQWQWWPWWLVDYTAAALLVAGALAVWRSAAGGAALLTSGWGFTLGMMWMSLAGNIAEGTDPERAGRVAGVYIALIATGMAWSLAGLVITLLSLRRPQSKL